MLKTLTEFSGVSGNEKSVADYIYSIVSPHVDSCEKDALGNLIFFKKGVRPTKNTIAVFAHMDEVGMIVTDITDDGYLKFSEVGSLDGRVLLAQRVSVGKNQVNGVIGIKAVHLQSEDERGKVIRIDDMYIDIGAASKEEAQSIVEKGDYITFNSPYKELSGTKFKAKAIDDRVGCAIIADLVKHKFDADIYFCFTVQEETGLRGAQVLSRRIDPDIAIVFEATTSLDTAFSPKHLCGTELGKGPVITDMDKGAYADKKLKMFIEEIAIENGIPYQKKLTSNGGNDSRQLQTGASGCRVNSISLPCRYIHSPASVADLNDYMAMKKLAYKVLEKIHEFDDAVEVK